MRKTTVFGRLAKENRGTQSAGSTVRPDTSQTPGVTSVKVTRSRRKSVVQVVDEGGPHLRERV